MIYVWPDLSWTWSTDYHDSLCTWRGDDYLVLDPPSWLDDEGVDTWLHNICTVRDVLGYIRPCPFCGGSGAIVLESESIDELDLLYYLHCQSCGCDGPAVIDSDEAKWLWNIRR
jgi:hypothetical protein